MQRFDQLILQWVLTVVHKNAIVDSVAIFSAEYLPYFLVLGFFVLLWKLYKKRERIFFFIQTLLIAILSRGIVTELIRFLWHRSRPFIALNFTPLIPEDQTWGFPSGHATFFFGLAIAVYFMNRKWGVLFIMLAALNAVARVYVGVHWSTDVIAGAAIGIISGYIIHGFLKSQRNLLELHEEKGRQM